MQKPMFAFLGWEVTVHEEVEEVESKSELKIL